MWAVVEVAQSHSPKVPGVVEVVRSHSPKMPEAVEEAQSHSSRMLVVAEVAQPHSLMMMAVVEVGRYHSQTMQAAKAVEVVLPFHLRLVPMAQVAEAEAEAVAMIPPHSVPKLAVEVEAEAVPFVSQVLPQLPPSSLKVEPKNNERNPTEEGNNPLLNP